MSDPEIAEPLELTVAPNDAGTRLDRFLAGPLGSRTRAAAVIDEGAVLVDGVARPKRHVIRAGAIVTVQRTAGDGDEIAATGDPAPFTIAFEDQHLLVVDKPAGVVVHPAAGHRTGTLAQALSALAAGGPDTGRAGIVHRLDRDTSGLIVVARSDTVHRALTRSLAAPRTAARVPRPGRRTARGAIRHDRCADRPRSSRPEAPLDRHRCPA